MTVQVDIEWSKQQLEPGDEATLSVKTGTKALCSLSTVDEATKFRVHDNFNVKTLVEHLSMNDHPYYYYYDYSTWNCENNDSQDENGTRYVWEPEEYSDRDSNMILTVVIFLLICYMCIGLTYTFVGFWSDCCY